MKGFYALFFFMVITIPVFLGVNAWQSNECGKLRNEIKKLEKSQENVVEANKTVVAEIAEQVAVDKLEDDARNRLGLKKIRPENVLLVIMGGKGRGH